MEVSSLPHPGSGLSLPRSKRVLAAFGDERLVDQLRRGNEAAFEVLYDRHHRAILSFCRHMLHSREEAEDAVQHTFIAAYNDLVGSDKEIKLKAWLFAIARNRCLSILRARREEAAELSDIPTAGLSQEVQQRDDLRRMLADMRELPEQQRAALVLSELGDLSHSEIADVVGCETMKVKSLVFQARSSLLESREARDIPCEDIREQLATLRGGALRRGPLRKHVSACPGCAEFREEVRRQRAAMAALLPVVPSAGLKAGVMGAIGGGGAAGGGALGLGAGGTALAGGGAAVGGSAGLGGIVSILAGGGISKVAVAAVLATGAAGGGVMIVDETTSSGGGEGGSGTPMADRQPGDVAKPTKFSSVGIAGPGGTVATVKRHDTAKESPTAEFFVDGGSSANPTPGEPRGNANGHDKDRKGSKDSKADGYYFVDGPGRSASRGNSQGSNGTRSRGNGNGRGGSGPKVPPRSPRSPNAGQPAPSPSAPPAAAPSTGGGNDKAPKPDKGTRGGKGPKLPDVTLP